MRISRACNLNHVITGPHLLDFGFEERGQKIWVGILGRLGGVAVF